MKYSQDFIYNSYERMLLLRRFEEKAGQLYGMGLIGGFCHLYIGQEAVAVGMELAKEPGDMLITSYRDHGLMLAGGSDPKVLMAELLGRRDGCSKGKGGSMHMFDLERGFYGGHGIVGAQVSLGTGLGFAAHYRQTKNISITLMGDGASNQGQVYESFNMAKLWNLPVVYIIENNEYAMGTAVARGCSITDLYKRGESFGIEGERVDGMDILAVYEASKKAFDNVRNGKGPYILEMKTYRYRGHSMSDPAKYRTKEEVEEYKSAHDPLLTLKNYMDTHKIYQKDIMDIMEKKVKGIVLEATEFAQKSLEPDENELFTDIYLK